jgi:hypothetical protein
MPTTKELKPERQIRRFDVFAEYRKQQEEEKGHPEDESMGYGLWVAKVVASRHSGGGKSADQDGRKHAKEDESETELRKRLVDGKWRTLDGEPQTDALFEKEIVERMGRTFYGRVFAPAIEDARKSGKSYESIRDAIRKSWKPGKN